MKHVRFSKVVALLLCIVMLFGIMPVNAFAISYDETVDDYYNVISKKDWDLAPGIQESEIILNNDNGSQRQVLHVVEADVNNEYVKVMPSYAGMKEALDNNNYRVQVMSEQTKWAEENGYGNIVASMNISLSWYDSDYYKQNPQLIGEPLGYIVMDGNLYVNSKGQATGARSCVVINFDEKDGEVRPANVPKVEIRATSEAITGWEEQVIPVNFDFLVKNGENLYNEDHSVGSAASRSFVGVKADGTIVTVMNDGRQAPYSTGLTSYEMAEVMLSLGCVVAVNGDGGGSSTFLSQRPGEEMQLHCSPSDGSERPTTHGIFFITEAPSTGEFVRANITTDAMYYTPGSTVQFNALGTDLVGTVAEIPAEATWQLKEADMGTIDNGVFVSNGKEGTATAQMIYRDKIVGECAVEIVIPTAFNFVQSIMTVPFGKEVSIDLSATVNEGAHEVVLKESDVTFELDNPELGTIDGFKFTAVESIDASAKTTGILTATLTCANLTAKTNLTLGKASEVIYDFEDGMAGWNIGEVNKHDTYGEGASYIREIDIVTSENGKVHNGYKALHAYLDASHSKGNPANGVTQVGLYVDESVVLTGAKSLGAWVYIPEDFSIGMIRMHYWVDANGDGVYEKRNTATPLNTLDVYNNMDESGWQYLSADVSQYESVMIKGLDEAPLSTANSNASNYRFIELMHAHLGTASNRGLGTINGPFHFYVDNITVDYSEAVEDREAPKFSSATLTTSTEAVYTLEKRKTVTTTDNILNVVAAVAENTEKANATGLNVSSAKAYVDGARVPVKYANGRLSISNVAVANGMHRVKFEICDNAGNKAVIIRLVNVQSGVDASTIKVVPKDSTLNRLYGGSVYWMNLEATDIESIESVTTTIDLNTMNHWELDHMELAEGFTASYTVDRITNSANITIVRSGNNAQTGAAVLASFPIRVVSYDDLSVAGFDPVKYWNEYTFWEYDLKVDVDTGIITYVDDYAAGVAGTFSNEEFSVYTEMYAGSLYMDAAFKAERGTMHVHSVTAVDDKAATCTAAGYTGRTFCEVCDSVVGWGTTVKATGHTYALVERQFVCNCGDVMKLGTGLFEVNGKYYYAIGNNLASGWQLIEEDYYFFDDTTFTSVESYNNSKVTFKFETNGKLISGEWYHTSAGSRYYYGPDYYKGRNVGDIWVEIDGKQYCFPMNGYVRKGINFHNGGHNTIYTWYDFGEDGAVVSKLDDYNGLVKLDKNIYNVVNGVSVHGMYKIDDAYYYFGSLNSFAAVVDTERNCTNNHGLLPIGKYYFGIDGKMLDKVVCCMDGTLYYYELGRKSSGTGSVEINGTVCSIDENGKVDFTGEYTDVRGVTQTYQNGVYKHVSLNGPVGDYFYLDDVMQKAWQLVEFEGDFYFINDYNKLAKNTKLYLSAQYVSGWTYPNGEAMQPGYYNFDADGKMIIVNGVKGDYFYVNGVIQKAWQLVEFEGDYYFINDYNKIVKNKKLYLSAQYVSGWTYPNGEEMKPGYYNFDADGKMIIVNGIKDDYFYVNGIVQKAWQLVKYEDNYYFINDYDKIAKNKKLYLSAQYVSGWTYPNGEEMKPGYYNFDAEGKMIVVNGIKDDYFYVNGIVQKAWQLVEYEGNYYFINDYDKIAKNKKLYLSAQYVSGWTYPNGEEMKPGYYEFDTEGKMIID